ncbi:phage holin family protein [Senegalia massiliensis]|uniref:Holin n=2 Tax=Senegalia massiliensis TaxID=1720316 RepID=A0A845QT87_9CLOT|nr:phage holin family protein [Senegalia massiliensis]NBI05755.1 holin [Senegalia massiliensis]
MDFLEFVIEEALIMVPVLYFLGYVLKNTNLLNDKYIPIAITLLSIGITPAVLGAYSPDNIVQAILVAAAAVFTNQVIKQTKGGRK